MKQHILIFTRQALKTQPAITKGMATLGKLGWAIGILGQTTLWWLTPFMAVVGVGGRLAVTSREGLSRVKNFS